MESENKKAFSIKAFLKGLLREIIVPVFLALIVIQYVVQAFQIPSGSMEDSLKTGDFLLGLKFTYGSPIPFSNKKFPEFTLPKAGDVVIFRYPGEPEYPDGDPERYTHLFNALMFGNFYWDNNPVEGKSRLVHFPDGPKDYIKRCVGVSGDTLAIHEGKLYVNGVLQDSLPGEGKYTATKRTKSPRDERPAFVIPSVGDTLRVDSLPLEMAWWLRSIIAQENPDEAVSLELSLLKDGKEADDYEFENFRIPVERDRNNLISDLYRNGRLNTRQAVYEGDTVLGVVPFRFFKNLSKMAYYPLVDPRAESGLVRKVSYAGIESSVFQDLEGNVELLNRTSGILENADTAALDSAAAGSPGATVAVADSAVKNSTAILDSTVKDSTEKVSAKPKFEIRRKMTLGGKPLDYYVVKTPQFFMMGDNRDNSLDSRYWGFVSLRNIKAKAFVVYFSIESGMDAEDVRGVPAQSRFQLSSPTSWWRLPLDIRWSRIGKFIPLID